MHCDDCDVHIRERGYSWHKKLYHVYKNESWKYSPKPPKTKKKLSTLLKFTSFLSTIHKLLGFFSSNQPKSMPYIQLSIYKRAKQSHLSLPILFYYMHSSCFSRQKKFTPLNCMEKSLRKKSPTPEITW